MKIERKEAVRMNKWGIEREIGIHNSERIEKYRRREGRNGERERDREREREKERERERESERQKMRARVSVCVRMKEISSAIELTENGCRRFLLLSFTSYQHTLPSHTHTHFACKCVRVCVCKCDIDATRLKKGISDEQLWRRQTWRTVCWDI